MKSGLRFSFRALEVPKLDFLKILLIPDFELLDSLSTHYHFKKNPPCQINLVSLNVPATSVRLLGGTGPGQTNVLKFDIVDFDFLVNNSEKDFVGGWRSNISVV